MFESMFDPNHTGPVPPATGLRRWTAHLPGWYEVTSPAAPEATDSAVAAGRPVVVSTVRSCIRLRHMHHHYARRRARRTRR
jgi:hypothetical protein